MTVSVTVLELDLPRVSLVPAGAGRAIPRRQALTDYNTTPAGQAAGAFCQAKAAGPLAADHPCCSLARFPQAKRWQVLKHPVGLAAPTHRSRETFFRYCQQVIIVQPVSACLEARAVLENTCCCWERDGRIALGRCKRSRQRAAGHSTRRSSPLRATFYKIAQLLEQLLVKKANLEASCERSS